jgi:hypothetical protein
LHAFIEKQEIINTQNAQTIADLKDTLAEFTYALSFQEKGKFPFHALLANIKLKKLYLILELV